MSTVGSQSDSIRVLVIGLGALGSLYSFLLTRANPRVHVTCVARSNFQPITDAGGLTVKSSKFGTHPSWNPDLLLQEGENGASIARQNHYDFVLVTSKAILENKTSDSVRPYLRTPSPGEKGPTIVLIQNGIGIEDEVAASLVPSHASGVFSAIAWIGANLRENGTVVEHGELERLEVGTFPSREPGSAPTPELQQFCDILNSGGGTTTPFADIQPLRWSKIFWNAAWGGACIVSRQSVDVILQPPNLPYILPAVRRTMLEVLATARSCGMGEDVLPAAKVDQSVEITYNSRPAGSTNSVGRGFKPSILVDLEAGRPMEVQAIIGNVIRLARKNGVDTPRLDMIMAALVPLQTAALNQSTVTKGDEADYPRVVEGWPIGLPL